MIGHCSLLSLLIKALLKTAAIALAGIQEAAGVILPLMDLLLLSAVHFQVLFLLHLLLPDPALEAAVHPEEVEEAVEEEAGKIFSY